MTRLRNLAEKVSNVVVRRTPENSKEWAQAIEREMEFISNDWTALRWALGSTRILLQRRETAVTSISDVPQAAVRFAKVIRRRTAIGCAVCMFDTYMFMSFAHWMRNPTQRLGCYLRAAAMLYMALQLIARRGVLSARSNLPASAESFRLELARQRDFHSGKWLWSRCLTLVPGFMLFCIGGGIAHPSRALQYAIMGAVFLFFCVAAVPANYSRARKYQQRIYDLDAVEKNEV